MLSVSGPTSEPATAQFTFNAFALPKATFVRLLGTTSLLGALEKPPLVHIPNSNAGDEEAGEDCAAEDWAAEDCAGAGALSSPLLIMAPLTT